MDDIKRTVRDADIGALSTSTDGQNISPGNIPEGFTEIRPYEGTGQSSKGLQGTVDYKQKELGNLIDRARGERTVSQYAAQAGVSRSTVSDLIHCRLPVRPTRRTLAKLFSPSAAPAAGSLQEAFRLAQYDTYEKRSAKSERNRMSVLEPMNILLDLLIETSQIGTQFRVEMETNGKIEIVDALTHKRYIGLPSMMREGMDPMEAELILKAFLLDEVFSIDAKKAETTYIVMVDDEAVYERAQKLPLLECRALYVVLADQEHARICEGVRLKKNGEKATWSPGDPL